MPFISREDIEATIIRMPMDVRHRQRQQAIIAKNMAWDTGDKRAYEQAIYKISMLNLYIYG
jgi:hypothetical protein